MSQTQPTAALAIGGVDISWIVGLAVICPLYVLMRAHTADALVGARPAETFA